MPHNESNVITCVKKYVNLCDTWSRIDDGEADFASCQWSSAGVYERLVMLLLRSELEVTSVRFGNDTTSILRSTIVFRRYSCVSEAGCSSLGPLRNTSTLLYSQWPLKWRDDLHLWIMVATFVKLNGTILYLIFMICIISWVWKENSK